jgi:hypothetical protein
MWKTSGARHRAVERLTRRDRWSTFSIALLSVVAIAIGLLDPHATLLSHKVGFSTATATAVVSVFILVISLIEGSSQTAVKADRLHDTAVRVTEARTRLEDLLARARTKGTPDWDALASVRQEYETKIRECPFNHEQIDYRRFEVDHRTSKEFLITDGQTKAKPRTNFFVAQSIKLYYLLGTSWLSIASWLIVATMLILFLDWSALFCRSAS